MYQIRKELIKEKTSNTVGRVGFFGGGESLSWAPVSPRNFNGPQQGLVPGGGRGVERYVGQGVYEVADYRLPARKSR